MACKPFDCEAAPLTEESAALDAVVHVVVPAVAAGDVFHH